MKKEIAVGLIVTVVGGILVYWGTEGVREQRREAREALQRAEQARQDEERREQEARDAAKKAAAALALRPRMSKPELNINRAGGDYKDFVASTLEACLAACEKEQQCAAITLNKSSRQCWMKSTAPYRSDDSSYISAVKVG